MSEVEEFYESFDVHIEEYISGDDEEEVIEAIFESEMNHKQCDLNDPRTIYDETQISGLLEDTVNWLKTQENRCRQCGYNVSDDVITEGEERPFGDGYCIETIVVGYKCNQCGNAEKW